MKKLALVSFMAIAVIAQQSFAMTSLLRGVLKRIESVLPVSKQENVAKFGGMLVEVDPTYFVHAKNGLRLGLGEEAIVSGAFQTGTKIKLGVGLAKNDAKLLASGNSKLTSEMEAFSRSNPTAGVEAVLGADKKTISHWTVNADEVDAGAFDSLVSRIMTALGQAGNDGRTIMVEVSR